MGDRTAVLFDVDGTLVDTNYLHVVAWWRAFAAGGHDVTGAAIHRAVGMGSDQLVPHLLGHEDDAVARAHTSFYAPYLEQLRPFHAAADLLRATAGLGHAVVLATSASEQELGRLREAIGADDAVDEATSKADVSSTKPAPDLVEAALAKAEVEPGRCVFVGDTVWDVRACARVGVPCVAVLSGGIDEASLRDAGAVAVYRDVAHLLAELADSPVGRLGRG